MPTEKIDSCTILRTGWIAQERRCPEHGCALELTFDETDYASWAQEHQVPFNHDDNRIRWRCESCVGSWTENHFLYSSKAKRRARLLLRCPSCSGNRVTHNCVPACCEKHVCIDCGAAFNARVETITSGRLREVNQDGIDPAIMLSLSGTPAIRSGFKRDFRKCPTHGTAMELAFVRLYQETSQTLLGWFCATCSRTWSESHFRAERRDFIADATAAVQCPVCGEDDVESVGTWKARCLACGSSLRISLDPE
ncbi:MAG: hypothetical protein HY898_12540 [Deltaproteobacteria bacterium]|nr:hypothetical protein [Deltaproteobacteria bacterium]